MKMKRLHSQNGITLLELVLCLAMLGILAYVASPIIGNSTSALSLDAAAKQVEADLRYAQNMATTTSDNYTWHAVSSTQYQVLTNTGAVATSPYNHQAMTVSLSTSYPNTSLTPVPADIVFTGGTGAPNAAATLTLQNSTTGTCKKINITATTGNMNVATTCP
jgi:type II secretory pathway pseudopilin PulG